MQCPHPITIKNPALDQNFPYLVRCESDGSYLTDEGELIPPTISVPCGRCIVCQNNRRDAWAARIELENRTHVSGWFVTLTYNEESCPPFLVKRDLQNFFKRLRKRIPCRHFSCGEYGDRGNRPHYHCIIWFDIQVSESELDSLVFDTWKFGFHQVKPVNLDNIRYVAKYTVKSHLEFPDAFPPPFAQMSRRPGIASNWWDSNIGYFHEFLKLERKREQLPRYFLDKLDPVEVIQIKRHKREHAEALPELSETDKNLRLINAERSMYRSYIRKYGK